MAATIGFGESQGFPMMSYVHTHACLDTCACTCACAPPHTSIHPPPSLMGTPGISKNLITLQLIKIFQFCFKNWNLWRLPHPWVGVWFGLVGRWMGGLMGGGKVKSLKILKMLTQSTTTKNLKCTLRCSNVSSTNHQWHWTPIIDHSFSTIHPMSKITQSAISQKPIDKNKKMVSWRIYFYTSMLVLGSKSRIQVTKNLCWTSLTSGQLALNGPANGSEVTYSKIQNRLSRAP